MSDLSESSIDQQDDKQSPNTAIRISSPLWRNRDYLLLWSGQTISLLGSGISQLAFPLLILSLTGSTVLAGLAGALRTLPYALFALPVGALIDRWDRKRVMVFCDIGRLLSLLSVPLALLLGHLTVLQLDLNALLEGTLLVFFDLAETACLPQVVSREQLTAASSQAAVSGGICQLLGPLLGGLLYSLGQLCPFLFDALSFAVSIISLICIRTPFQTRRIQERHDLKIEILEGLRWLWRQPLIRLLAMLTGIVNFVFPDSSALLILALARQQHMQPAFIGLIFTLGSCGTIIGAALTPFLQKRCRFGQLIIVTCWLMALLWLSYSLTSNLIGLLGITTLLFIVDPIYDIAQFSRRAALIPDELQGRVHSAYRLLALTTPPLGIALMGVLLQCVGIRNTVLLFSSSLFLLALIASNSKQLRQAL